MLIIDELFTLSFDLLFSQLCFVKMVADTLNIALAALQLIT